MLGVVAFWFDAGVPGDPGDPDEEGVNPGIVIPKFLQLPLSSPACSNQYFQNSARNSWKRASSAQHHWESIHYVESIGRIVT